MASPETPAPRNGDNARPEPGQLGRSELQRRQDARVTAVLGPTNTGKTFLAIERMLGHRSGMIGFPLRLLARENYDRVVRVVGAAKVALVTGEERIVPRDPAYFVCTVESMPLDRNVSFLAIDEIQMAADPERGHFFTDRLLHARGQEETMLLGADTARNLIQRLIPGAQFVARQRFSTLSYTGPKKLTRLPPRSAVVGFSASEIYAIAELLRRQRGGTAVVMGALSPRTRNAQVAMFQAGEVDYLVATDAIGMGLNMDVNHVAFSGLRKFDGRSPRPLSNVEMAQIAGRAGRHMNNGTFGTTGDAGPLSAEAVEAIENHRFDPLKALVWRNRDLYFTSVGALLASLNAMPKLHGLVRGRDQDDVLALLSLSAMDDIAPLATGRERVELLWDVCQVPDFRKTMSEEHTHLLAQLYRHLTGPGQSLPADWVDSQIKRLERVDGDIDTLMARIAHTRTWTYISHRPGWLDDARGWQERARALEDKLSDALHERLTQRFVDRRTALLVRRMGNQEDLMAVVAESGEVTVEGQYLGRLEGFRFVPDVALTHGDQRALMSAALKSLRQEIPGRLQALAECPDSEIDIAPDLRLSWRGAAMARLIGSGDILAPKVEPLPSDLLDGPGREIVRKRLSDWLAARTRAHLGGLLGGREADIGGAARGIMFRLGEALGLLPREELDEQLNAVDEKARKALARLGVRVGIFTVYLPDLLKPAAIRTRALLWCVAHGREAIPTLPAEGRTSIDLAQNADGDFLRAIGYLPLGGHGIRADMVERLAAAARQAVRDSRDAARKRQQDAAAQRAAAAASAATAESVGAPAADAAEAAEPIEMASPVCYVDSPELAQDAPADQAPPDQAQPAAQQAEVTAADAPAADAPTGSEPAAAAPATLAVQPPILPPGHFHATPQMLSYVGCSETEMAAILRALGYRVQGPRAEGEPHVFSMKAREQHGAPGQAARHRQAPRHAGKRADQRPRGAPQPGPAQHAAPADQRAADAQHAKQQHARPHHERPQHARPHDAKPGKNHRPAKAPPPAAPVRSAAEEKRMADSPFAKLRELGFK